MTDDVSYTKFSGEVKIVCKLGVISYEVWVNNKFLINADSYAKALAFLSDYLHIKAHDELLKHLLENRTYEANLYAKTCLYKERIKNKFY